MSAIDVEMVASEEGEGNAEKVEEKKEEEKKQHSNDTFSGTLRGETVTLKNVKVSKVNYTKREPAKLDSMRETFNKSERKAFLKNLTNDTTFLKKAGFNDKDILKMKSGKVPDGWQVHHKLPLDDSGDNSFKNLVLIKNEPYHKVITNYQNSITKDIKPGETIKIKWPIPTGSIYPAIH